MRRLGTAEAYKVNLRGGPPHSLHQAEGWFVEAVFSEMRCPNCDRWDPTGVFLARHEGDIELEVVDPYQGTFEDHRQVSLGLADTFPGIWDLLLTVKDKWPVEENAARAAFEALYRRDSTCAAIPRRRRW